MTWLISPLITLGDWVAKATLKLFGIEMTGAWLETEEEVLSALEIGELSVGEIMVPADAIVALSTTRSVDESFDRIRNTPHTRFPLVGETLTDFQGIVYAPSIIDHYEELVDGTVSFTEIAAPPMTLAAETNVSDAFDRFQAEDQELASSSKAARSWDCSQRWTPSKR